VYNYIGLGLNFEIRGNGIWWNETKHVELEQFLHAFTPRGFDSVSWAFLFTLHLSKQVSRVFIMASSWHVCYLNSLFQSELTIQSLHAAVPPVLWLMTVVWHISGLILDQVIQNSSSSLFGMHHQCVAPLAANLFRASLIASSKVRLCRARSFFRVAIQELAQSGLLHLLWGTAVRILLASADSIQNYFIVIFHLKSLKTMLLRLLFYIINKSWRIINACHWLL